MVPIDSNLVETLLNSSESNTLDFKQAQYPLASANQKGELLKDILAFANAWKTSDAYILVGVRENPGARAIAVGVSDHLKDADLQQLVSSKTNVPVAFGYLSFPADGKDIGVLWIAREQQRPVFLKKQFGGLEANQVYIRRGSSTEVARPDEIARMGASAATAAQEPQVSLELGDPDARATFGAHATVTSTVLEAFPDGLQNVLLARITEVATIRGALGKPRLPGPDPAELAAYRKERGLLARLGFLARNTGPVLLEDLRVVMEIPKVPGLRLLDELPKRPRDPLAVDLPSLNGLFPGDSCSTFVEDAGSHWEIVAELGKIQPNAHAWSEPFWIGSPEPRTLSLNARVYGDNISRQISVPMQVTIKIKEGWLPDEDSDDGEE